MKIDVIVVFNKGYLKVWESAVHVLRELLLIYLYASFPFGSEGGV